LYIRAYDWSGNFNDSAGVTVAVDNTDPSQATIVWPAINDNLTGTVILVANANDAHTGIQRVEFWNGTPGDIGSVLIGTNFTGDGNEYTMSWDTDAAPEGTHTLYIRVYDWTNHHLNSTGTTIRVDNTLPTLTIGVLDPSPAQVIINVTSNELLRSINVTVESPSGDNTTLSLTLLPGFLYQGLYTAWANDTFTIYVEAIDYVDLTNTNITTFNATVYDTFMPNFTYPVFSEPVGLLYNTNTPPTDWTSYPEVAGLVVNVTVQFHEFTPIARPFVGVWLNYSTNNGVDWTTIPMVFNGTEIPVGQLNISFYTVSIPRFHNDTTVLINIYALDEAGNVFDLEDEYEFLEYLVLGNWLETFNVSISSLVPAALFDVTATASIRNASHSLQVLTWFYNPAVVNLAGNAFRVWDSTEVAMTPGTGNAFNLTWPFPENITHGLTLYVSFQVVNLAQTPQPLTWDGSYSLANGTHSFTIAGTEILTTLATNNVTLGNIVDSEPPEMLGDPELSVESPTSGTDVEVRVNLSDTGVGIMWVLIFYRVGDGAWQNTTTLLYNGLYIGIIPKQGAGADVDYYIQAQDNLGNIYTSSIYEYSVAGADYSMYIFLIALIATVIVLSMIIRRRKKGEVKAASGRERYKLVKVIY
jgi:hypothetical protein